MDDENEDRKGGSRGDRNPGRDPGARDDDSPGQNSDPRDDGPPDRKSQDDRTPDTDRQDDRTPDTDRQDDRTPDTDRQDDRMSDTDPWADRTEDSEPREGRTMGTGRDQDRAVGPDPDDADRGGGALFDGSEGGALLYADDSGYDAGPGTEFTRDYTSEQLIATWERFFSDHDLASKIEQVADQYPDLRSIEVGYWDVDIFDGEFAAYLLEVPERSLYCAEKAVWNLLPPDNKQALHVRVKNLPTETAKVEIRHLRTNHLDTLIAIDGLVRKVVEVRPRLVNAHFQCSRCGAVMQVPQDGAIIREPLECSKDETIYISEPGCGRSLRDTHFKLLQKDSVFVGAQKIEVQEAPEGLRGGAQPERLTAYLEDDLVGQIFPGDRVVLNGILRAVPRTQGPAQKTVFDIRLSANSIELEDQAYEEVQISEEEEDEIIEMSRDPDIYNKITQSIAPSIYGMEREKEALMLQLFGGLAKHMPDDTRIRGDVHILLIGDPGTAKSQLLRYISNLAPRGIYASGKSASAAGLTAAAVKDEFGEGRWTLEAGALVLADKGVACIDELDKMSTQDRSSMHEAMEQQAIHVAKAGITATLQSRCSILAAANPKFGRFDEYSPIPEQINLPPALMSRFDLIFSITDKPNEKRDKDMAVHILQAHYAGEISEQRKNERGSDFSMQEEDIAHLMHLPSLDVEFLRKYIAHAKRSVFPVMTQEALDKIMGYYVELRKEGKDSGTIPITARQLEAFVRLAESSARVRLSDRATVEDADRAIAIVDYYLRRVAGAEGGGIDIDKITTGISSSQRDRIKYIRGLIERNTEDKIGGANVDRIYEAAEREGDIPREKTRDILQNLMREGSIYYPRHNVVSITPR